MVFGKVWAVGSCEELPILLLSLIVKMNEQIRIRLKGTLCQLHLFPQPMKRAIAIDGNTPIPTKILPRQSL